MRQGQFYRVPLAALNPVSPHPKLSIIYVNWSRKIQGFLLGKSGINCSVMEFVTNITCLPYPQLVESYVTRLELLLIWLVIPIITAAPVAPIQNINNQLLCQLFHQLHRHQWPSRQFTMDTIQIILTVWRLLRQQRLQLQQVTTTITKTMTSLNQLLPVDLAVMGLVMGSAVLVIQLAFQP